MRQIGPCGKSAHAASLCRITACCQGVAPYLVHDAFEVELLEQDHLVALDGQAAKPRPQIPEQGPLPRLRLDTLALQQDTHVLVRLGGQQVPDLLQLEQAYEGEVKVVKIGLLGSSGDHQVVGKPLPVLIRQQALQLGCLLLAVGLGQVVHNKLDPVHHLHDVCLL